MFKAAIVFLVLAIIAGLFAFVIPSQNMHEARIVFFTCGTLFVPCLLVALVREESA